jgi:hypothetical protein
MSMLQFVHTSQHDMHLHCWLHGLADQVSAAVPRDMHEYFERRSFVIARVRALGVPEHHMNYVGSCALAKLGHGGGL